jgi:zinc transport system permease protein
MLIVPAAAARPLARTPEAMALIAAAIGSAAVLLGLRGAYALDTPAGPSIVCAAAIGFALTGLWSAGRGAQ